MVEARVYDFWEDVLKKEKNHVYTLMGGTGNNRHLRELTRRESIVLTRLRIGHTRLTHKHVLEKAPQPLCTCQNLLTVDHLFTCDKYSRKRLRHNITDHSILNSKDPTDHRKVMEYIKAIKLFWEI